MALDDFEDMVSRYRMLWMSGRFGGGKTSLAVYLAARFCIEGWTDYICSNTPLRMEAVARLDPKDVHDVTDAVLLMDESWRYVGEGSEKQVRDWMAYMRKRNQVLLMPSVMKLARQLRPFRIERRFNGLVFGIPVWWYTWFLDSATGREKQHWFLWNPTRIFQLYDHSLPEMDDFIVYRYAPPLEQELIEDDAIIDIGVESVSWKDDDSQAIITSSDGSSSQTDELEGIAMELENVRNNSSLPRGGGSGGALPVLYKFFKRRGWRGERFQPETDANGNAQPDGSSRDNIAGDAN